MRLQKHDQFETLRESLDVLEGILQSTMDAIIAVDDAQRIVLFNAAAERMFACRAGKAIGSSFERFIPQRFRAGHSAHISSFAESGITNRMLHGLGSLLGLRDTGEEFPIEASISKVESGGKTFFTVVIRDITERQRAEEARLRHSAVIDSSAAAIISKNLDAVITSWNPGAQHTFGYSEAEVVGQPITILIPPELLNEENQILERLRAGKRVEHHETIRLTKAGKKIDVCLDISPFKDSTGRIVGFSKIAHDISDGKRAEEALRKSEERLQLTQKVAHIGTFEWNLETGVNTWTGELETMYGLPVRGFARTQSAFEKLVHPDDRANVVRLVDCAIESGEPTEGEWRVVWPDRSVHWIAGRWQVLTNESGEARMIGVNIDVTQRKRAEEALSGMTRKLVEAQEQERSRIARELHDNVNQRLALLAIELDQLRENPPKVRSRVEELRNQTIELSNEIQALAHDLHSSQLGLGAVSAMKRWCREFAKRQKMEINSSHDVRGILPPEIGLCLFRVLQEALHNAVKHSGVKRIDVQLREESEEIHLTISDLGRGFDVEAVKRGKGLGLTSMRERVRLINGTIVIDSKPMGGTTIDVRVPLATDSSTQIAV